MCARLRIKGTFAAAAAHAGAKMSKKYNIEFINVWAKLQDPADLVQAPNTESKIIAELHDEWCRANGYKPTSLQARSRRKRDHKLRVQASSPSQQAPGSGTPDKV